MREHQWLQTKCTAGCSPRTPRSIAVESLFERGGRGERGDLDSYSALIRFPLSALQIQPGSTHAARSRDHVLQARQGTADGGEVSRDVEAQREDGHGKDARDDRLLRRTVLDYRLRVRGGEPSGLRDDDARRRSESRGYEGDGIAHEGLS